MKESDKLFNKSDYKEEIKPKLAEFYKKLNQAISSRNLQSVWQLSKIITRYTLN